VSGCRRARLLLRLAHDHIALFECGAESRDVVLGQLVLVCERLDVLLLDEPALGGLLEQTLGRRKVVQVNGLAQLKILSVGMGCRIAAPGRYSTWWPTIFCYRQYEL
jgi:hypothetical protein